MSLLYCMYYYRLLYNFISILYALLSHFSDISAVIFRLMYQRNFCSSCSISLFLRRTLSLLTIRYRQSYSTDSYVTVFRCRLVLNLNCSGSVSQLVRVSARSLSLPSVQCCFFVFGVLQHSTTIIIPYNWRFLKFRLEV